MLLKKTLIDFPKGTKCMDGILRKNAEYGNWRRASCDIDGDIYHADFYDKDKLLKKLPGGGRRKTNKTKKNLRKNRRNSRRN